MPTIDHDPNEPPVDRTRGPWWWVWPILLVMWGLNLYTKPIEWLSVGLGVVTGIILTAWAIDITGNKLPDWWRSKPPGT